MSLQKKLGFTLIELLIVVSILAILVVIALSMVQGNRDKAEDAKIKSELNRLKIAFEDYYGDHNCYPPAEYFDEASDCGTSQLSPYLNAITCNPKTRQPYAYVTDDTGCVWYKLYGFVSNEQDALISPPLSIDTHSYNYGVSSSNTSVASTTNPNALPLGHNYYYCSSINNCTSFNHETTVCTPYYTDNPNCDGGANKCQTIGSCQPL